MRIPHGKQARGINGPVPLPLHLDPLTQLLDGIRHRCLVPTAHEMTAPWGVRFGGDWPEAKRKQVAALGFPRLPRGTIVAVMCGSCCLEVEKHGVKLPLSGGDALLITCKEPFILRDDWRTPAKNDYDLLRRENLENLKQLRGLRLGGGGVPTTFLTGGFISEDDGDHPLFAALPPVILIRASDLGAAPWLDNTLKFLSSELTTRLPGCESIINHLAHVVFVQAVRAYAASLPEDCTGNWFSAIFDSGLATALGLMHLRSEEPWTVARLAEQSGISRSAFAARFTAAVGRPPLQYLTECRMRKARELLRDTSLGIKSIAVKVGYSNESAFSQAFKRATNMSPGAYRRSRAARARSVTSR